METRALRNTRARDGEGRGEVLTWASGYNFPLFLVCPVDMPDVCNLLHKDISVHHWLCEGEEKGSKDIVHYSVG